MTADARTDEQLEREAFENFIIHSVVGVVIGGDVALDGHWDSAGHWVYHSIELNSHWLCWRAATRRFA